MKYVFFDTLFEIYMCMCTMLRMFELHVDTMFEIMYNC